MLQIINTKLLLGIGLLLGAILSWIALFGTMTLFHKAKEDTRHQIEMQRMEDVLKRGPRIMKSE